MRAPSLTILTVSLFCNIIFAQNLSKKALEKDLLFLQRAMEKGHPNLLNHSIQLAPKVKELTENQPDSIYYKDYLLAIRKLLYEVGCIHTAYHSWPNMEAKLRKTQKVFPVQVFVKDSGLFVRKVPDSLKNKVKVGYEIIDINGQKAEDIYSKMKYFRAVDGHGFHFSNQIVNRQFGSLYGTMIAQDSVFEVTTRSVEGELTKSILYGIKPKFSTKTNIKQPKLIFKKRQEQFSLISDSVGLLRISGFKFQRFNSFHYDVFKYLKDHRIPNLIVDLKDNLGGSLHQAESLIAYTIPKSTFYSKIRPRNNLKPYLKGNEKLKFYLSYLYFDIFKFWMKKKEPDGIVFKTKIKPKGPMYTGKIYVLANALTGSAASFAASYLKNKADATVIGSLTGGGELENNGGAYPNLKLPASGIKITSATYHFKYDIKGNNPNGIYPDHEIRYNLDTFDEENLELKKALELILASGTKKK